MKVFLSWSGQRSKLVAEALRDWLPSVIQEIEPFMSDRDIAAGARWMNEIERWLAGTHFAIVCLTRDNQSAPWLNFEAGAVAKVIDSSRVVPLAIDLKMTDVKPPLGHFHGKDISRDGIMGVLESLNELADRPVPHLAAACDKWWPDLEAKFRSAASDHRPTAPVRDDRDLLEEILASVRSLGERGARADEKVHEAEARAAALAHEAARLADVVARSEQEVATRRTRDRHVADLVLRDVSRCLPTLPSGSRVMVMDDYLHPRIQVQTTESLTREQTDEIIRRAGRYAFNVEFLEQPAKLGEGGQPGLHDAGP